MLQTELITLFTSLIFDRILLTPVDGFTQQPSYQINNLGVICNYFPPNFPLFPYNQVICHRILDLKVLSHLC